MVEITFVALIADIHITLKVSRLFVRLLLW